MRCRDGRRVTTLDELTLDGLDQCAVFGPGHTARPLGEDMAIYDGDNSHVATFPSGGTKYRFLTSTGGHVGVFKLPTPTGDEAIDRTVEMMRDRLAAVNQANAAYWKPKEEEA